MRTITKNNAKFINSIVRVNNEIGKMTFLVKRDEKRFLVDIEERLTTDYITYPIHRSEGFIIDGVRIENGNFRKLTSNLSKCFDIIDTFFYLKSEGLWCEKNFWGELGIK